MARFLSWHDLQRFAGVRGTWSRIASDGSVLAVRDVSSHQIHSLALAEWAVFGLSAQG